MIFDSIAVIFILLAMIAGYLGGGFRELLKLIILAGVFTIFKIPSVESAMKEFAGPSLYTSFYIVVFLATYFFLYLIFFFTLRGLIKEREGALGELNKTIGVAAGFFRGIAILFVMIYIFEALLKKNIFTEFKPYAADSLFYDIVKAVLEKTGLFFF